MLEDAMKLRFRVLVAVFMLIGATTHAEWIIVSEMNSEGSLGTSSMIPSKLVNKIKGNRTRLDSGATTSTIYDNEARKQIILDHSNKTFTVQTASQLKELKDRLNMLPNSQENGNQDESSYVETGKNATINGYTCKEHQIKTPFGTELRWVTEDFPDGDEIIQALRRVYSQYPGPFVFSQKDSDPPGFPIRTEVLTEVDSGSYLPNPQRNRDTTKTQPSVYKSKTTTTILSAERAEIPDSEFEIPPRYTEFAGYNTKAIAEKDQEEIFRQMRKQAKSPDERKQVERTIQQIKDLRTTGRSKLRKNSQR